MKKIVIESPREYTHLDKNLDYKISEGIECSPKLIKETNKLIDKVNNFFKKSLKIQEICYQRGGYGTDLYKLYSFEGITALTQVSGLSYHNYTFLTFLKIVLASDEKLVDDLANRIVALDSKLKIVSSKK